MIHGDAAIHQPYPCSMANRARPTSPDETDEGPSDEDIAAFSGVTRACPECKTELYDDTELCWNCGHALSSAPARKPAWVILLAVLVLVIFLFALIRW